MEVDLNKQKQERGQNAAERAFEVLLIAQRHGISADLATAIFETAEGNRVKADEIAATYRRAEPAMVGTR